MLYLGRRFGLYLSRNLIPHHRVSCGAHLFSVKTPLLSRDSVDIISTDIPPGLLSYLETKCKLQDNMHHDVPIMYQNLLTLLADYSELQYMAKEECEELKLLADQDLSCLRGDIKELVGSISDLLVPPEKYDGEDAVVEVVPGAGGQEASIFAEEIFNLYVGYTQSLGFQVEVREIIKQMVSGNAPAAGMTKGVASVSGNQVFSILKFESGVHRVQRVPLTAKNDKLHTSTCSVAVLPQARNIQVRLGLGDPSLKFEFTRASGAGGQGVNTTDSAVRLTHLETGIVVESQEQRSQSQNKQTALKKLKAILYQKEFSKDMTEISHSRKFQVGNMNRNEKIRTYNFSRHMVTDHRLGMAVTLPNLSNWLEGKFGFQVLEQFGEQLRNAEKKEKLDKILSNS